MQKCERCHINDARVRLNSVTNGRREQHFYCKECAQELLTQMNGETSETDLNNMFSSFFSGNGAGRLRRQWPDSGRRSAPGHDHRPARAEQAQQDADD